MVHTCWRTTATGVAAAPVWGVDARVDAPLSRKTGAVGPQFAITRTVPSSIATMLRVAPRVQYPQAGTGSYKFVVFAVLRMCINASLKI